MDYRELSFYFQVFQAVITLIIAIVVWINKKQSATIGSINRLEGHLGARIDGQAERIHSLELRGESCLHKDELYREIGKVYDEMKKDAGRFRDEMRDMGGQLGDISGQLKKVGNTLDLIQQTMIQAYKP